MCNLTTKTVKDGNNQVTYVIYTDLTKAKCYREGNEYKFNSYIVWVHYA